MRCFGRIGNPDKRTDLMRSERWFWVWTWFIFGGINIFYRPMVLFDWKSVKFYRNFMRIRKWAADVFFDRNPVWNRISAGNLFETDATIRFLWIFSVFRRQRLPAWAALPRLQMQKWYPPSPSARRTIRLHCISTRLGNPFRVKMRRPTRSAWTVLSRNACANIPSSIFGCTSVSKPVRKAAPIFTDYVKLQNISGVSSRNSWLFLEIWNPGRANRICRTVLTVQLFVKTMLFKIDKKPESGFRAYSANKGGGCRKSD